MIASFTETGFERWTGKLVRSLRRKYNDHCTTILTYHSISKDESCFTDMPGMRHAPAAFEAEMDYLVAHFEVVSLRDLTEMFERGEQPRRAVAITFDDGFADTLRTAMPILYRRRIPFTVFPVTSVVDNADLLWQHKLAWLCASGHVERVRHALQVAGWPPMDARESLQHYVRLYYRHNLPALLENILGDVGTSGQSLAADHKLYLTRDDIASADPEFVEFGNHTDTHPVLASLTSSQQAAEIDIARRKLLELTGRLPVSFAYPFGLKRHYNDTTRKLVIDSGHRAIVDMRRRMNVGVVSPYELSRKPGPCNSFVEFQKMVEAWPANAHMAPPQEMSDADA